MSFKEGSRNFLFKVTGGKCIYEEYMEETGFIDCGKKATHVHHIYGESEQLMGGEDPEHSPGIPVCPDHHVRNRGEILGDPGASFHPDVGEDYGRYHDWKNQQLHMNSITGRNVIDYSTSPFAETSKEHKEKVEKGERYINGDERTDEYYAEKIGSMIMMYLATHPNEHKPQTKQHPQTDHSKRKHWWNIF